MTWGQLLGSVAVIIIVVSVAEMFDPKLAMMLAIAILLAILFHNRKALADLLALLPQGGP